MSARGFLGAGDLYIARYNPATGNFDPFLGPYEATKFEIKPNVELKELSSRGRATYGQVIESVPLAQPSDFTVELAEINRESLSIALLGTNSAINQSSGTINNEAIALKKGAWVPLSKQNFAQSGFVVTNVAGTTTYALDTDYVVNWRMGWVKLLEGSSIPDNTTVHVDGTYNAITGTKIAGATNTQIRAKFRLDGVNFADQLPVIVDVWEAVIAADAAFDFLSSDFASLPLPGRLKTPVGKTNPFEVQLLDTAI